MACIDVSKFVQILSALLIPAIAVVTVLILFLQYRLARRRWRLDLYDKRYPVFIGTMDYIADIVKMGTASPDRTSQFLRESRDKEFLFKKDVRDFLTLLYKKSVELYTTAGIVDAPHADPKNREALIHEMSNIKKWFGDQFEVAKKLFEPYLKMTQK